MFVSGPGLQKKTKLQTPERHEPCSQGTYRPGREVDIQKTELSNTFKLSMSIILIYLQHFPVFLFFMGHGPCVIFRLAANKSLKEDFYHYSVIRKLEGSVSAEDILTLHIPQCPL